MVIEKLMTDPGDRRMVVTAWNPGELGDMALPPCHMLFQFFAAPTASNERAKLSLHMIQRSCDMFLGVPFNIASYALLLSMVAQVVDMEPHECILSLNDAHIYHDHFDAVNEQLSREPKQLPDLWLNPKIKSVDEFTMDDIRLENYEHHPAIKAKMAV
jgi:thymidylate synthase